jgi:hypothetical protein
MTQKVSLDSKAIVKHLESFFNVVVAVRIVDYDDRLSDLFSLLQSVKKDVFEPQDRIVFIVDDTQYYINNEIGITLHNLQQILYQLDIPNYFCLIIGNQEYFAKETGLTRKIYGKDSCKIDVLDCYVDTWLKIDQIQPVACNFDKIEKNYVFLSRVTRKHRVMLYSLLANDDLLDRGLVSFHLGSVPYELKLNTALAKLPDDSNRDICLLSPIPWTRTNESWQIYDDNLFSLYDTCLKSLPKEYKYKNFSEGAISDIYANKSSVEIVQKGFLYLGIGTMFHYPGCILDEKEFKGIANKRPFVLVGAPGNLKKLKKYGFKTFDQWWNESYDDIQDPSQRMLAVYEIIKQICNKPLSELIKLGNDMRDVLEYNFNHLIEDFGKSQLWSLQQQCIKNSKPRHDTD